MISSNNDGSDHHNFIQKEGFFLQMGAIINGSSRLSSNNPSSQVQQPVESGNRILLSSGQLLRGNEVTISCNIVLTSR